MAKKRRRRRYKKSIFRRMVEISLLLALVCIAAGTAYVAYVYHEADKINPADIYSEISETSYLYDSEGKEIDTFYFEDRDIVPAEDIPTVTKEAFIAIEDKTFYTHHGFNFKRMAGAVFYKIVGKSSNISGTSTITQQLARNVFLTDIKSQRTIRRKVTEAIYAFQIEQALSKEEIIEAYLNTIYLGYGCYGIQSAAEVYFSKSASELELSESAFLAALPQAPDRLALLTDSEEGDATYNEKSDVYVNNASRERRDLVLLLMKEQGYITEDELAAASVELSEIINPGFKKKKGSLYTYFSDYVASVVAKDLSEELAITEKEAVRMIYTKGLRIYSTIDTDIQKTIRDEFKDDSNFPYASEEPEAAMVVCDVKTGHIVAMAGGRSASGKKIFNRATSPRQPGSSIKPLSVYSAALQKSFNLQKEGKRYTYTDFGYDKQGIKYWGDYITAGSLVVDEKMIVNGNIWPKNATRTYSGNKTFRTALQQSINTCAVKIYLQVGAETAMTMLNEFGISTAVSDTTQAVNDMNPAALALGAMTYGVTPLDMAVAYTTFPNGGTRSTPVCYTKIEDREGNVILEPKPEQVKVLDEGVAWIMTDVLKSVVSRGIAGNAAISGTEAGGKTGTTNDNYDIWFCGFTPKYSAALWIGTDHNKEMTGSTSAQAAALWSRILSQTDAADGEYREKPSNVITYKGEYFTSGTENGATGAYAPKSKKSSSSDSGSSRRSGSNSSGGDGWIRGWQDSDQELSNDEIEREMEDW